MTTLKGDPEKTTDKELPEWERRLEEEIKASRELTPEEMAELKAKIREALKPHLKELRGLLRQLKKLSAGKDDR